MGRKQNGSTRCLIDTTRLHADKSVLNNVDTSDSMRSPTTGLRGEMAKYISNGPYKLQNIELDFFGAKLLFSFQATDKHD